MVTILGAGNGGQALAVHFERLGFPVKLWNRGEERIRHILSAAGEISVDHIARNERFTTRISFVTTDIAAALEGSRYVFIVTPGTAHREIARVVSPYVNREQVFILIPGRTFGSVEFLNELKKSSAVVPACFEAQTILHACRIDKGVLQIFGEKNKVLYSTNAFTCQENILTDLSSMLPTFMYCSDYLGVTLNNIGALVHPTPTILNTGRIESGEKFFYYTQGITRTIASYIQKIDDEREKVCKQVGCLYISLNEWLFQEYGVRKDNIYESLRSVEAYQKITAPDTLFHRYVFDDICTGLVPLLAIGKSYGIPMPATEAVIMIASQLVDYDFMAMGRTVCLEDIEKCISHR